MLKPSFLTFVFMMIFTVPVRAADRDVTPWTAMAVAEAMTFNFADFDRRKTDNRKYFTAQGYESFYKALNESGVEKQTREQKLMVETKVVCDPVIVEDKTDSDGARLWVVEAYAVTNFVKAEAARKDAYIVKAFIKEVSLTENPDRLGIGRWIAAPATPEDINRCK